MVPRVRTLWISQSAIIRRVGRVEDAIAAAEEARRPQCPYNEAKLAELNEVCREAAKVFQAKGIIPWPFYHLSTRQIGDDITLHTYRGLNTSGWPLLEYVDEGPMSPYGAIQVDGSFRIQLGSLNFHKPSRKKLSWHRYREVIVKVDVPPSSDALGVLAYADTSPVSPPCVIHGMRHPTGHRYGYHGGKVMLPDAVLSHVVEAVERLERATMDSRRIGR